MNENIFTSSHVLEKNDDEEHELVANDAATEKARDVDATSTDDEEPDVRLHEAVAHQVRSSASVGLLDRDEIERLRMRWAEIQIKFVDEPRAAVQQADTLIADVIEKINQLFTAEHNRLEGQWQQNNDLSTEELRQSLQRYRAFFNRLVLSAE